MKAPELKLEKIAGSLRKRKNIHELVLRVERGDGDFTWPASGAETPYYIASITKMYTAAAAMLLREKGKLNLDDPLVKLLPAEKLRGIHVYKGRDYLPQLRVHHLLAQTSGLADYFEQKNAEGETLLARILDRGDVSWTADVVLDMVRSGMKPAFAPSAEPAAAKVKRKAFYSDTNYQLLGEILKKVTGRALGALFNELIFEPLELKETYVFGDDHRPGERGKTPLPIYHKDRPLNIPGAMGSFGADGAVVSTAADQIKFLRGFMGGKLFTAGDTLDRMMRWNRIFFPLEYGYGLMRFQLPRIFSPFQAVPEFVGHSGSSGSFLFHCPERNLYIAGTLNQVNAPDLPFRILPGIAHAFPRKA